MRLLKLRVDEIEVRAHTSDSQAVRLVASSMAGQWLKTDGYLPLTLRLDTLPGVELHYGTGGQKKNLIAVWTDNVKDLGVAVHPEPALTAYLTPS